MYISMGGWLGEGVDERDGHVRQPWTKCAIDGPRQRRCEITFWVKFRHAKSEFLREAERAFARWMTPERARLLVARRKDQLEKIHAEILGSSYPQDAPVCLIGALTYRGGDGDWRVVDLHIQGNMTFNKKQIESGKARCF